MFRSIIDIFANVASSFTGLPVGKKIALMVVGALVMAGLVVLSLETQKSDYEVLFSKLSSEDMGKIVGELKNRRVNYKIAAGETAIMVPSRDVFDLRIQLASAGLPKGGGVGFEIFDKTTLGMTEFIQKLNLMRAITGELTRTINSLDTVDNARVHIASPKKSVFLEEERKTTASVVLKLRGQMSQGQVQGIVHLVASSVEGLSPEDVTIVDIRGNILAGGREESIVGQASSSQLEFKRNIENTLESRIKSMLGGVLGLEKVSAKVSVDVDFQQMEQTEEIFDPESQVIRSEQKNEETSTGSTPAGGVVGAAANQPGGQVVQLTPPSPPKSQKTNETVNYEINKIVRRTVGPVGTIKKLSIAVMVDGSRDEENKYVPRTAEDIQQYKKIVERAVGYDEGRGDKIEVVNVPFDVSRFEEEKNILKDAEKKQLWISIARYATTAIFIVLLFIMLIKPLIAWLSVASEKAAGAGGSMMGRQAAMVGEGGEEADEATAIKKKEDYRQVVQDYAREEPTHTAELVRKWLKERR